MAVRLEGSIKRFIGLSTDVKPTADIPMGSTFLEEDTGRIYRYGFHGWAYPDEQVDETLYVLQALLAQVTELTNVIKLATAA